MLSQRGQKGAERQDVPWRFAPGRGNRYDAHKNPAGVISFALAENHLVKKELGDYVRENVVIPDDAFTYGFSAMGGPLFPAAMAQHLNRFFNPFKPVEPNQVISASSLTAIHEMVGSALGDPGDGILVSRPVYGRFELDFGNTNDLNMAYADCSGIDPFSLDVIPRLQSALDSYTSPSGSIKALLIVNPHNPLGRCYPESVLLQFCQFCQRNSIHLLSDEVYGLSVYPTGEDGAQPFRSLLSFETAKLIDPQRLHILYGMSKDFAAAGLRLGCLITQNAPLRKAMADNVRFHGTSGPSIAIGSTILQDHSFVDYFIKLSRERLASARRYTIEQLERAGIEYERKGNAGFFLFIDLSPWLRSPEQSGSNNQSEYDLAQRLLDAGVGVHPCEEHFEKPGHFRLVFSQERHILEEGLKRLLTTLGPKPQTRAGAFCVSLQQSLD